MATTLTTFDRNSFDHLAAVEPGHFWFEQRRSLIQWSLRRFFPGARSFCEVGCGTGFVLAGLEPVFPSVALTGVEYHEEALVFARKRLTRTHLLSGDINRLPFKKNFDVVGCFDVLEHIPDDQNALDNLADSIRPGGGLIVTVPQHPWLWSSADIMMHHQRRYTRIELRDKLQRSGLNCSYMTSFMAVLLPALWASRSVNDNATLEEVVSTPGRTANLVGSLCLAFERRLISLGMTFPAGSTLVAVANKPLPT